MTTIFSRLEAKVDEGLGYTTYVFSNLEESKWDTKYKMVTRCPNWDHRNINIGEEGFLTYEDHIAEIHNGLMVNKCSFTVKLCLNS